MSFDILGRPKGTAPFTGIAGYYSVSPGYFEAFKFLFFAAATLPTTTTPPLRRHPHQRSLCQAVLEGCRPLARPPAEAPGAGPAFAEPPRQIIGIVGDTRDGGLDRDPAPIMYIPLAQMPDGETALNSRVAPLWWVVRTYGDPHAIVTRSPLPFARPPAASPSPTSAPWKRSTTSCSPGSASTPCS